jgi:hypothetical protein
MMHKHRKYRKGGTGCSPSTAPKALKAKESFEVDPNAPCIPNPVLPKPGEVRKPIGPVVLERYCDSDRPVLTPEDMKQIYDGVAKIRSLGCGIKFRWYLGSNPVCPNCGISYPYTVEDLKKKKFLVSW